MRERISDSERCFVILNMISLLIELSYMLFIYDNKKKHIRKRIGNLMERQQHHKWKIIDETKCLTGNELQNYFINKYRDWTRHMKFDSSCKVEVIGFLFVLFSVNVKKSFTSESKIQTSTSLYFVGFVCLFVFWTHCSLKQKLHVITHSIFFF